VSEQAAAAPVPARRLAVRADLVVPWVVRLLWVAMPFTAGPVLGDALAGASRPVQLVASSGLWLGWSAAMVATAVALPVSLTVLRTLAPAATVLTLAAAAGGHPSALAVGWSVVTLGWAFAPAMGALCVNGPAYPNERRFPLRPPGALLAGPLVLAWSLALAGVAAGPLLLAARQWALGAVLTAVGLPLAYVLLRATHDLSRRWLVLVPAGLVVHDPLTIVDPILLPRRLLARIGPALAGTDARDLTQKAPGLALQIDLQEDVELALVRPARRLGEAVKVRHVLVTPTRPGAFLEAARARRLPVR
jgi:hypothetical protein